MELAPSHAALIPELEQQQAAAEKTDNPEYESAIEHGSASFSQLAECYFTYSSNPDPRIRLACVRDYPRLLSAFQAAHGTVTRSCYCPTVAGAAALTLRDEIHIVHPEVPKYLEIKELLFNCERLHTEARRLLEPRDRQVCSEQIFGVVNRLLRLLDSAVAAARANNTEGPVSSDDIALLKREFAYAEDYYARSAGRRAQIDYFLGMLAGLGVLALVIGLGSLAAFLTNMRLLAPDAWLGSLIAGGVGAVVSVLSRMSSGGLVLQYEVGWLLLRLLGGFRPVIGSIFGTALYILLEGGLVPIAGPSDPMKQVYFFSGIAFLAGFSERWAQDMLVVSESRVGKSPARSVKPAPDQQPGPASGKSEPGVVVS